MKKIVSNVVLMGCCVFVLHGCTKNEDFSAEINTLIGQMRPLQVYHDGEKLLTITADQAMAFHETHEHSHSESEEPHAQSSHLCMGVLIGYKAIDYAVQPLFGERIPNAADFDIRVSGPMDGVWDVMSLYCGRELNYEGDSTEMNRQRFTFTAKRLSSGETIVFCIRDGLVPEAFYGAKNQGATCGHAELRKNKQQALFNILSAETQNCFELATSMEDN